MARSLADLKKTHGPRDVVAELKKAIAGMPRNKYETTHELATRSGIGQNLVGPLFSKFPEHVVESRGPSGKRMLLWARTPADAKKLRDALKSQNG